MRGEVREGVEGLLLVERRTGKQRRDAEETRVRHTAKRKGHGRERASEQPVWNPKKAYLSSGTMTSLIRAGSQ